MTDKGSAIVELLKLPVLVFSILVALVAAKRFIGLEFGAVTELSTGGVKFAEKSKATFDALTALEVKVNQALVEIEELKRTAPTRAEGSKSTEGPAFEAAQTVSDQTARVEKIVIPNAGPKDRLKGYAWIGNFKTAWSSPQLAQLDTGQPVTLSPDKLQTGTEYTVLGNLVVRDGLPSNDRAYFNGRSSVGVVPRGTRVRLMSLPTGIDREYAVQYWAEIEVTRGS